MDEVQINTSVMNSVVRLRLRNLRVLAYTPREEENQDRHRYQHRVAQCVPESEKRAKDPIHVKRFVFPFHQGMKRIPLS